MEDCIVPLKCGHPIVHPDAGHNAFSQFYLAYFIFLLLQGQVEAIFNAFRLTIWETEPFTTAPPSVEDNVVAAWTKLYRTKSHLILLKRFFQNGFGGIIFCCNQDVSS